LHQRGYKIKFDHLKYGDIVFNNSQLFLCIWHSIYQPTTLLTDTNTYED
jgi:hypothetical protein